MAYVQKSDYRWDVFLSYAWANDTTSLVGGVEKRWVTEFQRRLHEKLKEKLAESGDVAFFKDTRTIPLNQDFESVLEAGLTSSAAIVVLMSTRYRTSEWCRRELRRFAELRGGHDGGLAESGRVFVVNLENVHPDQWKPDISRWLGKPTPLRFYSEDPTFGTVDKLALTSDEFGPAIVRLATDLAGQLDRIRADSTPGYSHAPRGNVAVPTAIDSSSGVVTLGAGAPGDEGPLNELERYLLSSGLRVLRAADSESDDATWEPKLNECLRQSGVFAQIIGPHASRRSALFPQGVAQAQFQLARRQLGERRVLQWRHPNLVVADITDIDHRQFIDGAEFFGYPVEFAGEVRRRAIEMQQIAKVEATASDLPSVTPPTPPPSTLTGETIPVALTPESTVTAPPKRRVVLVKVDKKDDALYDALSGTLRGVQIASLKARNGLSAKRFFEQRRDECIGVFVVQGLCDDPWLQERSQELLEVDFDIKEGAPVHGFYVNSPDASLYFDSDSVLKVVHGDPESTQRLLDALRRRGGLA